MWGCVGRVGRATAGRSTITSTNTSTSSCQHQQAARGHHNAALQDVGEEEEEEEEVVVLLLALVLVLAAAAVVVGGEAELSRRRGRPERSAWTGRSCASCLTAWRRRCGGWKPTWSARWRRTRTQ
jgi:hypothetical protein